MLLTPGPALSARGRSASAGTHPFPCVPRVPPALSQVGTTTYLIQQIGDGINVMVGLRDPDHALGTQDWGRGPEGEPHTVRALTQQLSTVSPGLPQAGLQKGPLAAGWHLTQCQAEASKDPQSCDSIMGSRGLIPRCQPCLHLGVARKMLGPLHRPHDLSTGTVPAPLQDSQTERGGRERAAAETGSEVTSPAENRLELQYK